MPDAGPRISSATPAVEAREAYELALELVGGQSRVVNKGQILF